MIYNSENFPELPCGWASLSVDDSVDSAGNSNKKLKSKDALDRGRFPVIDQGQSDISGYSDDESLVVEASESNPVILFGDHTRLLKKISQPFVPGADGTKLFRAKSFWDTRFVYQMLRAIKLPDKGYARHFQYLRDSVLPLPPLSEQKRIADKLDAVLARVDACLDRLDRIPTILKRFRQSVLAAATSGKLTEEWRSGAPIENTWSSKNLGDYVENCDGKRVPISEILRAARHGDYPYYGASGVIDTIDGYTHDGKFLLIGEDGANLLTRSKPIAFIATGKIWVNNHAHVLQCRDGAPEEYLGYFINSIDLAPYVSGSAQPKLNQKNMNSIVVPVPPVVEQTEIVRRVEALFAFADRLEARHHAARAQVEKLTPATLAKAFRGELVPQDPNDEPASKLLERIRANSTSASTKSSGRKHKNKEPVS